MSPDNYLRFTSIFISYCVKVTLAYLLCLLVAQLLRSPRQRFRVWMLFMLGSLAGSLYALTSFFPAFASSPAAAAPSRNAGLSISHQFLVPVEFQHRAMVIGRILGMAYIACVLLLVSAEICKRVRLHFFLKQGRAPSGELRRLFAEMCRGFGVRNCDLLILPKVSSPATVGWWRPRIVLPPVCQDVSESGVIEDVLHHELAHVARRDYLWAGVSDWICRLLFFHPAIWQGRNQARIHREMACDGEVVAARPEHRADYAQTLTRVARLCLPRRYPIIGIDFAAAPSLLARRVRAILNDPGESSWLGKASRATACMVSAAGWGFLCSAVALGIAFAPSIQSAGNGDAQTSAESPQHSALRHKAKKAAVTRSDGEGLITESPAYRLRSSPGSPGDPSGISANFERSAEVETTGAYNPDWTPSGRERTSVPASSTVRSIIIATVGTVLAGDKDDRGGRRKDSSHYHFLFGKFLRYNQPLHRQAKIT